MGKQARSNASSPPPSGVARKIGRLRQLNCRIDAAARSIHSEPRVLVLQNQIIEGNVHVAPTAAG